MYFCSKDIIRFVYAESCEQAFMRKGAGCFVVTEQANGYAVRLARQIGAKRSRAHKGVGCFVKGVQAIIMAAGE